MTSDQDLPNTVGDEAAFWQRQRELPHGPERPESPTRTSRIISRWVVGIIIFGIALGMVAAGRAAERTGPTWQVWVARYGEEWKPVGDTKNGEVACNLLILKVTKSEPSGTLIACRRTQ